MIQQYTKEKYTLKIHTGYFAEAKHSLGLPMFDAPNDVEKIKRPRQHPTEKMVGAIKEALKHFETI